MTKGNRGRDIKPERIRRGQDDKRGPKCHYGNSIREQGEVFRRKKSDLRSED